MKIFDIPRTWLLAHIAQFLSEGDSVLKWHLNCLFIQTRGTRQEMIDKLKVLANGEGRSS